MRWRIGISSKIKNREAAVGVQMFHMRQRWGAAVWRAQTQVLLGRLKCALPGRGEPPESRRAADTAGARRRPVGGHTPVGLATAGGSTAVARVLGTAATWVASTGNRAAGREVQTPRKPVLGGGGGSGWAAVEFSRLAVVRSSPPTKKRLPPPRQPAPKIL
jgi:hypothetical protein